MINAQPNKKTFQYCQQVNIKRKRQQYHNEQYKENLQVRLPCHEKQVDSIEDKDIDEIKQEKTLITQAKLDISKYKPSGRKI